MRTTLAIDDDVLSAAKHLAARQDKSVGEVLSALARLGLSGATRSTRGARAERNGIPLLPATKGAKRAAPVTLELVNLLRDEMP